MLRMKLQKYLIPTILFHPTKLIIMKPVQVFVLAGILCLLTSYSCSKSDDISPRVDSSCAEVA